jgi:molecular chaperone DnaJ
MDYYQILGVEKIATPESITKAYRKLARLHHPDRNIGDQGAEAKFKEVQGAYDILSDPAKRKVYDTQGYYGRRPPSPPPKPPSPKPEPKTKEDFERERTEKKQNEVRNDNPSQLDLESIQCTFFGGSGTGRNILVQLKLTPTEMKNGCSKKVVFKRRDFCRTCVGDGLAMKMCPNCKGSRPDVGWCPVCDGQGATPDKCPVCKGEGVHPWKMAEVRVRISGNVQPGHTINILGEGESAPRKPPGNLRVVVVP